MGGINTKTSQYNTTNTEFLDLSNMDFTTLGALTKRPGTSLFAGSTVAGRITGIYEFERLNGASYLIVTANTNAYYLQAGVFNTIRTGLQNGALFDFQTFVDRLFAVNGTDMFVYDGTTARSFSLPYGVNLGGTLVGPAAGTGFSGIFQYAYGYLNDRGFFGPAQVGLTINPAGASAVRLYGFTTPIDYGITAIVIYRTSSGGSDPFLIGYAPAGASLFLDNNLPDGDQAIPTAIQFTLIPRYLEVYNNQMIYAGFSGTPSTVWFSEIGEPEDIEAESFFEVRTNDGDRVTALKSYLGRLMVFKERSFSVLSGDNPTNFTLKEVTDQYGCLSNRATVVWENKLWFLDRKGICEYNGANVQIVSNAIEPIFNQMNIDAARENAEAIHFKSRNELWFHVPCNGATINNTTMVYDYVANAWTKYEGFQASSLQMAKNSLVQQTAFYGSYSGAIAYFSTSLVSDLGQAITCLIKTRFLHDLNSQTEQFRRFYLDANPVLGQTASVNINFYQDYGSSIVASRTMYLNTFQTRVDFGIPAKSLQAEISNYSATLALKVFGFTIEYKYQRST